MISRRKFLGGGATLSAAALTGWRPGTPDEATTENALHGAKAAPGSPNVLIFMPDQQNGKTVLADSPVLKPHMDKFRTEAVTFTSAHCPAPHCCPSRASFMSGLYPSEHGVYNNVSTDTAIHQNPYPGTPFWGLWLKDAGYDYGIFRQTARGSRRNPGDLRLQEYLPSRAGLAPDKREDQGPAMAPVAS